MSVDVSQIKGNVPDDVKNCFNPPNKLIACDDNHGFGDVILSKLRLAEVSLNSKAEEPSRQESRVVCLLKVEPDMINKMDNLHGGCSATIIDICSSICLTAYALSTTGQPVLHVSQSLNVVYHSPAVVGDELRIVNTTMTWGSRTLSARTEIWNDTQHRLVASGVHIKMQPSLSKEVTPKL